MKLVGNKLVCVKQLHGEIIIILKIYIFIFDFLFQLCVMPTKTSHSKPYKFCWHSVYCSHCRVRSMYSSHFTCIFIHTWHFCKPRIDILFTIKMQHKTICFILIQNINATSIHIIDCLVIGRNYVRLGYMLDYVRLR